MSWDFIRTTFPKASKPHRCEECARTIEAGEKCQYTSGKCEGDLISYRLCLACSDLASAWCDNFDDGEGFPMGDLRSDLAERGVTDLAAFVAASKAAQAAKRQAEERRLRLASITDAVIREVTGERFDQVASGRDQAGDDQYKAHELARGVAALALAADPDDERRSRAPWLWPWFKSWKPRSHRENMVRAAAMAVAEIERIDREALS